MRISHRYKTLLILLFLSIFIIGLFHNANATYARSNEDKDDSLIYLKNFQMQEFSNAKGLISNASSLEIDLNSSKWNISSIYLNFTMVKIKEKDKPVLEPKKVNPKNINLAVIVNKKSYKIEKTELKLIKLNFKSQNKIFKIPITHNQSNDKEVRLFIDYSIGVECIFSSKGSVLIVEDSPNLWSIKPQISRFHYNHSIKFEYPKNWYNVKLYKNNNDITTEITLNQNWMIISNETITNNAVWLITANSPNIEFSIDVPDDDYGPEQELKIYVIAPIKDGEITCVLIDPSGEEEYSKTKKIISEETTFSYRFSSDPPEGDWKIIVFWSNDENAGVQTDNIEIVPSPIIDQQMVTTLVFTIIIICAITSATYLSTLSLKNVSEERKQKILDRCHDLLNLNYVIIIENESGLGVYEQYFPGKNVNSKSISKFIDVIRSFGIELLDKKKNMWTIKLDYNDLKIIMTEINHIRINFVMKEVPSQSFLNSINDLARNIQESYGLLLEQFNGLTKPFEGIKQLLERHLQIYFLYPLKVHKLHQSKVKRAEESLITLAKKVTEENNLDYFYVKYLFPDDHYTPKDIEKILHLIDKEVFQPLYMN